MIPPVIVPITTKDVLTVIKTMVNKDESAITRLEEKISEYTGSQNCILTNSGRTALYLLLKAYGLKQNDEVIMPAYMCQTVSQLLFDMGMKVKFVDIEPDTYNISIDDLSDKISKKTKVILVTHMFGYPCRMNRVMDIAQNYDSIVIEDAAQAMGADYEGRKVGTVGNSGFFSFGRGKPITTMGGGLILTNDAKIAEQSRNIMKTFRNQILSERMFTLIKLFGYSMLKNKMIYRLLRKKIRGDATRREIGVQNLQFKPSNVQASIGLLQLKKLEVFNKIRRANAKYLYEHFKGIKEIDLARELPKTNAIYLRYPIKVSGQREKIINRLLKKGVESSVVYPIALSNIYHSNSCPNAEKISRETLALPTHPLVKKKDIINIKESVLCEF